MARSTGGVMPLSFLTVLRDAVPQFAERNRTGNGYAQQGILYCLAIYGANIAQMRRSVGHS